MKFNLLVFILATFVSSCSKDFAKVSPDSVLSLERESNVSKIGAWNCYISFSITPPPASTKPIKSWIEAIFTDFNSKGASIQFSTNNNQNNSQHVRIQFLPKENFITSQGVGVFSFPNYGICKVDSLTVYLNSDFDWTENLVKKTVAYQLGRMLDLPYRANDISSIMNPELSQPYSGMTPSDIQNYQAKFSKSAIRGTITKGVISARSISFNWAISNPQERPILGSGLCWSSVNSNPTINDEKNYYPSLRSGYWATGWNKPGAIVYFRSYYVTDCDIIYSPVLAVNVPKVNTWEAGSVASFSRRTGAAVVATDGFYGKAYFIGGRLSSNNSLTNEVWMHQPGVNLWRQVKSFPGVLRESATSFYFQDKIYYGFGYVQQNYTFQTDWWEYNTTTDTWTQKRNLNSIATSAAASFSTLSGGAFTLGITNNNGVFSQITRQYSPSNDAWFTLPNFPLSTGHKGFASIGDNLYILMPNNRFIAFNGNYWYEAPSFQYESSTTNPSSQYNTMISCQNNVYYGAKGTQYWYQYAPTKNAWNRMTNAPTYFSTSSMFYMVGDKIYVIDGNSQQTWEYNVE